MWKRFFLNRCSWSSSQDPAGQVESSACITNRCFVESWRSVAGGVAHRAEKVYYRFIVPPVELTFSQRLHAVLIPLSWWLLAPAARAYAVLLMSVKLAEMGNQTQGELNPPFSSNPVRVNGIKPQIDSCYSCLDTYSVYSVSVFTIYYFFFPVLDIPPTLIVFVIKILIVFVIEKEKREKSKGCDWWTLDSWKLS